MKKINGAKQKGIEKYLVKTLATIFIVNGLGKKQISQSLQTNGSRLGTHGSEDVVVQNLIKSKKQQKHYKNDKFSKHRKNSIASISFSCSDYYSLCKYKFNVKIIYFPVNTILVNTTEFLRTRFSQIIATIIVNCISYTFEYVLFTLKPKIPRKFLSKIFLFDNF